MIYKSKLKPFEVMVQLDSKEFYRIFESHLQPPWPSYFKDEFKSYVPIASTKIVEWVE